MWKCRRGRERESGARLRRGHQPPVAVDVEAAEVCRRAAIDDNLVQREPFGGGISRRRRRRRVEGCGIVMVCVSARALDTAGEAHTWREPRACAYQVIKPCQARVGSDELTRGESRAPLRIKSSSRSRNCSYRNVERKPSEPIANETTGGIARGKSPDAHSSVPSPPRQITRSTCRICAEIAPRSRRDRAEIAPRSRRDRAEIARLLSERLFRNARRRRCATLALLSPRVKRQRSERPRPRAVAPAVGRRATRWEGGGARRRRATWRRVATARVSIGLTSANLPGASLTSADLGDLGVRLRFDDEAEAVGGGGARGL